VTSLVTEQFAAPATSRGARVIDYARNWSATALAGRTVWCAAAAERAIDAANRLQRVLGAASDEGVAASGTRVRLEQPLLDVIEQLDASMRGSEQRAPTLGARAQDILSGASRDAEALIPGAMQPGDVLVVHDPVAATLAQAVRDRGAHAVWHAPRRPLGRGAAEAWRFVQRSRPALDAYVVVWPIGGARPAAGTPAGTGPTARTGIAAYISAPGLVSAKEVDTSPASGYELLGWTSLLADVVSGDREDRVGGTLHARPAIARR
jgi:hypothetical protein